MLSMKALVPFKRKNAQGSIAQGSPYYVRFEVRKKAYLWSTKTDDLALAKIRGKEYRKQVIAERFDLVDRMHTASSVATFSGLIAAYEALPSPAPSTRKANVHALEAIMEATGLKGYDRLNQLTSGTIKKYQQMRLAQSQCSESSKISCNSRIRCARSLFSKRSLAYYGEDLKVPEETVKALFSIPMLKEPERRPELPGAEALAKVADGLKDMPDYYRAYALGRFGGLRAGEIKAARRDWLENNLLYVGGKDFTAKSKRWRVVELPAEVVALLHQSDDLVYLVGSRRAKVVDRELPTALQKMGFPRKPIQSLRRLFGSLVFNEQGARQAKAALGHLNIATTEKYYLRSFDAPKAVAFVG
jgi:integrase